MTLKKIVGLLTLAILFAACSNTKETAPIEEVEVIKAAPKAIVASDWNSYRSNAPIEITETILRGNQLSLYVRYSGGCKEHGFQLVGHRMIAKSLPPQRSVKLIHDNKGDDCRQIIEDVLVFDIYDLAHDKGETALVLDGVSLPVIYRPGN